MDYYTRKEKAKKLISAIIRRAKEQNRVIDNEKLAQEVMYETQLGHKVVMQLIEHDTTTTS
jgi:type III secretory pathway component EscU